MVVAKVKAILHKKNSNGKMGHLKNSERYVLIQVETPNFILGVEDDNFGVIHNYMDTNDTI